MKLTRQRAHAALTILAVTAAGGLTAHEFTQSNASRATSQQRYSDLQRNASSGRKVVPFLGPFAHGKNGVRQCGPEVRLMEGALRLTTPPVRLTKAENCVGVRTVKQIRAFQRRHKIPATGIYGLRTHKALAHAYTKTQISDLNYIRIGRIRAAKNLVVTTVTAHAKAFEGRMIYCEYGQLRACGRRFLWPPYPDVPRHTDCSGYVTWVFYQAGLPDPNGLGFSGGFTGTLVVHGVPISPTSATHLHIGDLIFNGPSANNTTHVSIYVGHGISSGHGRFGIQLHQWNYRTVVAIRRYY